MALSFPKIELRTWTFDERYKLDRVKLTKLQHGPLGGIDRKDGARIVLLWNLARRMSDKEIIALFEQKNSP